MSGAAGKFIPLENSGRDDEEDTHRSGFSISRYLSEDYDESEEGSDEERPERKPTDPIPTEVYVGPKMRLVEIRDNKPKGDRPTKKASPPKARKAAKPKTIAWDEDEDRAEERPSQVPVKSSRPLEKAVFEGAFGKMVSGYLDIYVKGIYIVLVESLESEFSYSPPVSDDPFTISFAGREYRVTNPGISFEMPGQEVTVMVLLDIAGGDYE